MSLVLGTTVSLRTATAGGPVEYVRHLHGRAVISPVTDASPDVDKLDASWRVRPPLAVAPTTRSTAINVSLESVNFPGGFLRHRHGEVHQDANDGSEQFAVDATFIAVPADDDAVFLVAMNFPYSYVRHYEGKLYIATKGGAQPWDAAHAWDDDITWLPTPAWADG